MNSSTRPDYRSVFTTKGVLVVLLGWSALSVITATTAYIALQADGFHMWLNIFRYMIRYYVTWAAFSFILYGLLHHPIHQTLWIAPIYAIFTATISLILPFTAHFENWREWLYGSRAIGFHSLNIAVFIIVLIGLFLLRRYQHALDMERSAQIVRLKALQLEHQLANSQMTILRSQINPHFLFNALNSIGALIETRKNDDAYHATEVLGQLLRSILERAEQQWVNVIDEVAFIQNYIDMEKIRFGDKLFFNCNIEASVYR